MIKILTSGGTTAAWYEYDAWGNVTGIGGNAGIANLNPIRYRGYYYDTETGFYYLNSRYYDPEICRFVNADDSDILWEDQGHLNEHNLYMYCWNDPIKHLDFTGEFPILAVDFVIGDGMVIAPPYIGGSISSAVSNFSSSAATALSSIKPVPFDLLAIPQKTTKPVVTPNIEYPGNDGSKSPGKDYEWKGKPPVGGDKGSWVNKNTGEQLHPDLDHPSPVGPHWDYTDIYKVKWRIYPGNKFMLK